MKSRNARKRVSPSAPVEVESDVCACSRAEADADVLVELDHKLRRNVNDLIAEARLLGLVDLEPWWDGMHRAAEARTGKRGAG